MYPLHAVLVNCDDSAKSEILSELMQIPAHVEAEFPDFDLAMNSDDLRGAARLFVVQVESDEDVENLKHLSTRFAGWPVLVATRQVNDQKTVFSAMRAGASQITRIPILSDDFQQAMQSISRQHGFQPHRTDVIAVVGAAGGCGRSTVALNLAHEIAASQSRRCVLVDLAIQLGAVHRYLNIEPRVTAYDLLRDMNRVDTSSVEEAIVGVAERFGVLTGPTSLVETSGITVQDVDRLVEHVRRIGEVVVLNIPATFDESFLHLVSEADKIVIVAEQTLPAVANLKALWDCLKNHHIAKPMIVALNRYNSHADGLTVSALEKKLHISPIATIRNDHRAVQQAETQGRLLSEVAPNSVVAADIRGLMEFVFPVANHPRNGRFHDFLARLGLRHRNKAKAMLIGSLHHHLVPEIEQMIDALPEALSDPDHLNDQIRDELLCTARRVLSESSPSECS